MKLAHTLAQKDQDFILVEHSDTLGGRIRSIEFQGRIFEAGAYWIQGTETKGRGKKNPGKVNPVWKLAQEVNLDWEDDSDPTKICLDAENNGKNITKKVDRLCTKLEKIS